MPFHHPSDAYTKIPTRTPADTIGLVRALIVAAPPGMPAQVKTRLNVVRDAGINLQQSWITSTLPAQRRASRRAHDRRLDRVWRKVKSRNLDWHECAIGDHDARAAEVDTLLFPTGLDFITLRYPRQWAESERRLVLIKQEGLGPELDARVGAAFMQELRDAHATYGKVLEITVKAEAPAPVGLADALREAQRTLGAYARLVYTLAELEDDTTIARAEAQLEPILRFREPRSSADGSEQGATGEAEAEEAVEDAHDPEEAPLPELPEAP